VSKSEENNKDEVICEFFGLKIATKNPNLAKVLKTEVSEFMNLDVQDVKGYLTNPEQKTIDSLHYNSDNEDDEGNDLSIEINVDDVTSDGENCPPQEIESGTSNDEESIDASKLDDDWLDKNS